MRRELRQVQAATRKRAAIEEAWVEALRSARSAGLSLATIATEAGVTRGRVHQITGTAHAPDCSGSVYSCPKCGGQNLTIEEMFDHNCR